MLKKLILLMTSFLSVSFFAVNIFAEAASPAEDTNPDLLADYTSVEWTGDTLYLDEPSTAVYFMAQDSKPQSAAAVFQISESDTGFYFRIDAGNGGHSGGDSGFCTISFYDEEHSQLLSLSTGQIQGLDNYTRFYIGDEASYFPIPEKASSVEISLNAVRSGSSDRVNVYFRNLSLHLSGEKPLLLSEKKIYLDNTPGLTKVEIGVTSAARYLWIAIIFLVALTFYIIRMWQQKYSTAKVMKAADRKTK